MNTVAKPKNYVNPSDFFNETLLCIKRGEVSDELGKMFMLLSERYVNSHRFVRYYHIREDLISTGVVACCRAYDKFRPDRNTLTRDDEGEIINSEANSWDGKIVPYDHNIHYSPFAYFTSVVHNALIQFLRKEYKNRNIINAIRLEEGLEIDYGYEEMLRAEEEEERLSMGKLLDEDGNLIIREEDDSVEEEPEVSAGGIIW